MSSVRRSSPEGGFVKLKDEVWHVVSERDAREKVGQAFRDMLHIKYRSSTKSKSKCRTKQRGRWNRQKTNTTRLPNEKRGGDSIISHTAPNDGGNSDSDLKRKSFPHKQCQEQPLLIDLLRNELDPSTASIADVASEIAFATQYEWYYDFLRQLNEFLSEDSTIAQQKWPTPNAEYIIDDLTLTPLEEAMLTTDLEPVPLGESVNFIASPLNSMLTADLEPVPLGDSINIIDSPRNSLVTR